MVFVLPAHTARCGKKPIVDDFEIIRPLIFVRVFSEWEQAKVDRLREHGYRVQVLHPGITKAVEASEIRNRMAEGEPWEELVPPAVARVIKRFGEGEGL